MAGSARARPVPALLMAGSLVGFLTWGLGLGFADLRVCVSDSVFRANFPLSELTLNPSLTNLI